MHAKQVAALEPAERFAFPDFREPAFVEVLVARGPDGRPTSAICFRRTTEVFMIGCDPWPLRRALAAKDAIAARLHARGVDDLHAFVPRSMESRMRRWLSRFGFRRSNPSFNVFYREV